MLTFEQAKELLRLEPKAGQLFWRDRPSSMFTTEAHWRMWNTRFAGKEAFVTIRGRGYLGGVVFGKFYSAHRVCWLLHYGEWPHGDIDHINGVRTDNRIFNLRDTSKTENMRNSWMRSNNTSGVTGVYWFASVGKWRAHIKVDGKQHHLGYFDNIEDAAAARASANEEYGFSKRHGRAA